MVKLIIFPKMIVNIVKACPIFIMNIFCSKKLTQIWNLLKVQHSQDCNKVELQISKETLNVGLDLKSFHQRIQFAYHIPSLSKIQKRKIFFLFLMHNHIRAVNHLILLKKKSFMSSIWFRHFENLALCQKFASIFC